jgi:hypothetical protein
MATAWVIEYANAATINGVVIPAPLGDPLRVQTVTFTGTPGVISNAVDAGCGLVGIYVSAAACFKGGTAPTAALTDAPIAAGVEKFFVPTTRWKYSFIAQS